VATKLKLSDFLADRYSPQNLAELELFFEAHSSLHIPQLPNGLFMAVSSMSHSSVTGYQDFWLRDNAMIASSFILRGDFATAVNTMLGLNQLLRSQEPRFREIIRDPSKKDNVQERPHVRFRSTGDSPAWSHAQNDALGYVLWLRFTLANAGKLELDAADYEFYCLFPLYFATIDYSNDADSGAWEEDRKVNSSSVGAVVAGLRQMQIWLHGHKTNGDRAIRECVDSMIERGTNRLQEHLPFESPPTRYADAASLFLIHPAQVLNREQENAILNLIQRDLVRQIGVIRYVGDSYYGQDYPDWFSQDQLTADFSQRIEERNAKLRPGFEAQWCLFDSLLSVIYGDRFLSPAGAGDDLATQTHFFNRSLRQLTPEAKCPELYFCHHGSWVPNPQVPLAWAQANLALALEYMKRSAQLFTKR
jgi:hypothetical protein